MVAEPHTRPSWSGFCKRWHRFGLRSFPQPTGVPCVGSCLYERAVSTGPGLMNPAAVTRRHELSRAFSRLAGCAAAGLGASVLIGWWLDSPRLKSAVPGLAAMNPLTAIALILLG